MMEILIEYFQKTLKILALYMQICEWWYSRVTTFWPPTVQQLSSSLIVTHHSQLCHL